MDDSGCEFVIECFWISLKVAKLMKYNKRETMARKDEYWADISYAVGALVLIMLDRLEHYYSYSRNNSRRVK